MSFDGKTFDPAYDENRLEKQIGRVYAAMITGHWFTLEDLASKTGDPVTSISARLRDLRKPKFGGYLIERKHRGLRVWGLFEYKMSRVDHPQNTRRFDGSGQMVFL